MHGSAAVKADTKAQEATLQALKLTLGSRVVIPQDTKLSGEISIGSGTVLHPTCYIEATGGPIHIGCDCILEENVRLINSSSSGQPLVLGSDNHIQVGTTIEMLQGGMVTVGDWTTFEVMANVSARRGEIKIGKWCKIGVGVTVQSTDLTVNKTPTQKDLEDVLQVGLDEDPEDEVQAGKETVDHGLSAITPVRRPSAISAGCIPEEDEEESLGAPSAVRTPVAEVTSSPSSSPPPPPASTTSIGSQSALIIPDYSVLYSAPLEPDDDDDDQGDGGLGRAPGPSYRIRTWSGEGIVQEEAAFAKHLEYLREALPRANKLRQV